MRSRIVISEFMDAPAVQRLAERFDVDYRPKLVDEPDALGRALAGAQGWIVRNRTQVRGPALDNAGQLRVVGRLGVGLDNIDLDECRRRDIEVIAATGANAESVAEYVVTAALVLLRGAYFSTKAVAAGTWPRQTLSQGREAAGKTVGIVGFGSIGRLTARKCQALGMRVVACDEMIPGDSPVWKQEGCEHRSLDALVAESDVISLHVPLTAETRGLIDARRLALMKPGAVLVNTARGGIVDEAALATRLREGKLGGAALDVFEEEPLTGASALADAPRLVLTPHIAGVTQEANERVSALIAHRVAEALTRG